MAFGVSSIVLFLVGYYTKDLKSPKTFAGDIVLFSEFVCHVNHESTNKCSADLLVRFISFSGIWISPICQCMGMKTSEIVWVNVFRLLCVRDVLKYFKRMVDVNCKSSNETIIRLSAIFMSGVFFSSLAACCWFYISCQNANQNDSCIDGSLTTWISEDSFLDIHSAISRYVRSYHFVLQTIFTIGYGDIHPRNFKESIFAIVLMICATLFMSYLISSISSFMSHRDVTSKLFFDEFNSLDQYLNLRRVDATVRENFRLYFEYLFKRQGGLTTDRIFTYLPPAIVREIKKSLCVHIVVAKVPFFKGLNQRFITLCIDAITIEIYPPGGILFQKDVLDRKMVMILKGSVVARCGSEKGSAVTLGQGDQVGDYCVLFAMPLGFDVVCSEFTEVGILTWESLSAIISANQDICQFTTDDLQREVDQISNMRIHVHLDDHLSSAPAIHRNLLETMSGFRELCANVNRNSSVVVPVYTHTNSYSNLSSRVMRSLKEVISRVQHTRTSSHRFMWDIGLVVCILLYNFVVPTRLLAGRDFGSWWDYSMIIEYALDIALFCDCILHAAVFPPASPPHESDKDLQNTTTISQRRLIRRPQRLRNNPKRFLATVMCTIPLSTIGLLLLPSDKLWSYMLLLKIPKLFSFYVLMHVMHDLQHWLEKEKGVTLNAEFMAVLYLAILTLIVTLWISAGWSYLHFEDGVNYAISSLYWCLTTFATVGYGDIYPMSTDQTVFNLVAEVAGPILFATIVAKFTSYVKRLESPSNNLDHRRTVACHFAAVLSEITEANMKRRRRRVGAMSRMAGDPLEGALLEQPNMTEESANLLLSPESIQYDSGRHEHTFEHNEHGLQAKAVGATDMVNALQEYFGYLERGANILDENRLLKLQLPKQISGSLRSLIVETNLMSCKLFSFCDDSLHRKILAKLQQQIHYKGQIIVPYSPSGGMYFVKSGSVEVRDSRRVFVRCKGQYFSEQALLAEELPYSIHVAALTNCELWYLSKTGFSSIFHSNPKYEQFLPQIKGIIDRDNTVLLKRRDDLNLHPAEISSALSRHNTMHFSGRTRNKVYITPDGKFSLLWTALIIIITLVNFFLIPARIAYGQGAPISLTFLVDYLGDIIILVDMILKANVIAYYDQHDLVTDRQCIFNQYIKSWRFRCHVIASLPLDLLYFVGKIDYLGPSQTLSVYRLGKLVRLLELQKLLELLYSCSLKQSIQRRTLFKLHGDASVKNVLRLVKLTMAILMIAYVTGAVYFFIASQLQLHDDPKNWANAAGILPDCTSYSSQNDSNPLSNAVPVASSCSPTREVMLTQGIYSIYWAITVLTTTGYGDITPVSDLERIFNIIVFVMGTLMYATVIAHMEDIVSQLDVTKKIFTRKVNRIQAFLKREGCSGNLEAAPRLSFVATTSSTSIFNEKVSRYFETLWATQRGVESSEIATYIPSQQYKDILRQAVNDVLPNILFISTAPVELQDEFISKLTVRHYVAGEYIFRVGQAANRLHIIVKGTVALESRDMVLHRKSKTTSTSCSSYTSHRGSQCDGTLLRGDANTEATSTNTATTSNAGNKQYPQRWRRASSDSKPSLTTPTAIDGTIGEWEFFSRATYPYCSLSSTDSIILEIDYASFWSLLEGHRLVDAYASMMKKESTKIHRSYAPVIAKSADRSVLFRKVSMFLESNLSLSLQNKKGSSSASTYEAEATSWSHLWNLVTCLVFILQMTSVPYSVAFIPSSESTYHVVMDAIACAVFCVDIYINRNTTALPDGSSISFAAETNINITSRARIWFCEVISTLPVSLIVYGVTAKTHGSLYLYSLARLLAFLRVANISSILRKAWKALNHTFGVNIYGNVLHLALMVAFYIYLAHVIACAYCCLGVQEMKATIGRQDGSSSSWIEANDLQNDSSFEIYLQSYYWAFYSLSSVGYGNIAVDSNAERVFAVVVMIMGSMTCAGLLATIESMVELQDDAAGKMRRVFQAAQKFCESHKGRLDESIAGKVDEYFRYISSDVDNSQEDQDFALLPPSLRAHFVLSRCSDTLREMRWVNDITSDQDLLDGFVYSLCEEMELYLAIPGEILDSQRNAEGHQYSSSGSGLLILRRGTVVAQCGRKKSYFQPGQSVDILQAMQLLNKGEVEKEKETEEEDERDARSPRPRPRKLGRSSSVGCIPEEDNDNYHSPHAESPVEHKANYDEVADDAHEEKFYPPVVTTGMLSLTTAEFFNVPPSLRDGMSSAILRLQTEGNKAAQVPFTFTSFGSDGCDLRITFNSAEPIFVSTVNDKVKCEFVCIDRNGQEKMIGSSNMKLSATEKPRFGIVRSQSSIIYSSSTSSSSAVAVSFDGKAGPSKGTLLARNRQNSEWAMTSVVSADSTEFGVDDLCAVGPDIYLTNSSCEVDTTHNNNNNNNNNDDDGDSSSASPVKRDGLFSAPIFERSFQWTRRESKYRLDNNSSNVYSSDNSSSNNNNNGNEVVPIGMAMAQSPRHSSSLTWRGSASFRLAPSSSFFSKMHSPSRQLHHRNHQHHQHHHHHNLPHDDSSDDFPVETGFSVVVVGPDDSSNQPSSSPRRKLKHAFSSSYLFKSRNLHSSSRYNLKKKKSTHENLLQEIRGLRLLTCTGTGTATTTTTTVGRKEPVSTSCRIVQGDVINGEHGSIGILHAKFTLMTSSPAKDMEIVDGSITFNKNCRQKFSSTNHLDTEPKPNLAEDSPVNNSDDPDSDLDSVTLVSETYSHFFKLSRVKMKRLEEFYRLSLQPVPTRLKPI